MGYQQHIIKSSNNGQISFEEFQKVIQNDQSLLALETDSNTIQWNEHPLGGIEGNTPLLFYSAGRISSRKLDEFITKKMFEIADILEARLVDDEDVLDDKYRNEIEQSCQNILRRHQRNESKPWWKFW